MKTVLLSLLLCLQFSSGELPLAAKFKETSVKVIFIKNDGDNPADVFVDGLYQGTVQPHSTQKALKEGQFSTPVVWKPTLVTYGWESNRPVTVKLVSLDKISQDLQQIAFTSVKPDPEGAATLCFTATAGEPRSFPSESEKEEATPLTLNSLRIQNPVDASTLAVEPNHIAGKTISTILTVLFALALGEVFKQFVAEESRDPEIKIDIHWDRLPALLAFLFLIFPFYQGTIEYFNQRYIEGDPPSPSNPKVYADIFLLTIEGGLFFVMSRALSPFRYLLFYRTAGILLGINVIWLLCSFFDVWIPTWWWLINLVTIVLLWFCLPSAEPDIFEQRAKESILAFLSSCHDAHEEDASKNALVVKASRVVFNEISRQRKDLRKLRAEGLPALTAVLQKLDSTFNLIKEWPNTSIVARVLLVEGNRDEIAKIWSVSATPHPVRRLFGFKISEAFSRVHRAAWIGAALLILRGIADFATNSQFYFPK